jgi:hypothetical protein
VLSSAGHDEPQREEEMAAQLDQALDLVASLLREIDDEASDA